MKESPSHFRTSRHPRVIRVDESGKVISAHFGGYKAEREFCKKHNAPHLVAAVQTSKEAAMEYLETCMGFERCGTEQFERAIAAAARMGPEPALLFMGFAGKFSVIMRPLTFAETLSHLVRMNGACADFFLRHEYNFRGRPGHRRVMEAAQWRKGREARENPFTKILLKIRNYVRMI